MKRGDVVRAELPRPAGAVGREQFGTRPAIVLQGKQSPANLATVIIVPLTSNVAAARFPGSFVISPDSRNGLTVPSVVLTHQIRAIDKKRLQKVIGRISPGDLANLEGEVRKLLGL